MGLLEDIRNLGSLSAFRDFEPEALRLIAFTAETIVLRAGDTLFRRGDTSDGGYVVLGGALTLDTGNGLPLIVEPPTLLGEAALVTETVRPATALACEPSSVLRVSRELYRRILAQYPESASRVRRAAATRVLAMNDDLEQFRQRLP